MNKDAFSDIANKNDEALKNILMEWTPKELEVWCEGGLIPIDLVDEPSKHFEMAYHLIVNKKILLEYYRENTDENRYQIIAYPNDEEKIHELHIIEKCSGSFIKILEKSADFELCEGVVLKIKAKEIENWKKDTEKAKKLTKEQIKNLKSFIEKFSKEKSLTRKEITTFIDEIQKPQKIGKYRQSGHLVDEKLKYTKPNQPTIFDLISPQTKDKIKESKMEITAEGIKLTPPENKIIHALNRILHEKSQTRNPKAEDFYKGNTPPLFIPYGQNKEEYQAAVLKFKPSELYKAYMGKEDYSGGDILFINSTLRQLEEKKVLLRYDRIKKVQDEKKEKILTDRIEDFQSLIKIILFIPDLTNEEKEKLDGGDNSIREAKGELVIALNPIFTDQIDTKFIEFPIDTNRRLVIAAGGHKKVTASMQTLMEWMLRELSAKRCKTEINEENLPYVLGLEKYVKQKRKKLLDERIGKDIKAMLNLGILLNVERKQNSTGGIKWVFELNRQYE